MPVIFCGYTRWVAAPQQGPVIQLLLDDDIVEINGEYLTEQRSHIFKFIPASGPPLYLAASSIAYQAKATGDK